RGLRGAGGERDGPVDSVLQRAAGRLLCRCARLRHRRACGLVPRAAVPRRLPAAVAVRGLVPVARPHRGAHRTHHPGRRGGVRGGRRARRRRMSTEALEEELGGGLAGLRELLLDMGGLLATLVGAAPAPVSGGERDGDGDGDGAAGGQASSRPAMLAAAGPRAAGRRAEYELLVEAIYEGYLLHYRSPRVLTSPTGELGLLAGDQLYAIGLARLVALGDADAVSELADTSSLSALAHAAGDEQLAGAVWQAGARAVGWGPSEAHTRAKEMVCESNAGALAAMRTSAAATSR